ncbi:cytochrome c maturation protein CcmE [Jannaschia sp. CCS1]|uniref:cytochrome c maturation protein CcmE domain-containing protein n=1 Tax=Jannaschia sp. (strain CCS1) TaxID=290400 RepID=UPI000053D678|nr:cytochrome c maturation protein CcmE [Jannaschia sp. CCS1]ABD54935.1 cytochrome c-type biogenesis protein CcmE [Jannaschia sp. CCS1]
MIHGLWRSQKARAHPDDPDRNGGLVEERTLMRGEGSTITFRVTDGCGAVPVSYNGILRDLIAKAQGMIGTRRFIDGNCVATEILARHDET